MADAGYRLTVEGEAEFRRALADINAQVKLNKSEINALTAEYNANGGSLETLQQKQEALGKEMTAQQQKVDLMRQRLEDAKAAYGENSAQVTKLQTDLNNASGALSAMQKQYNDTTKQIEDATHSTASYDEAVKQAEAAIAAEKAELDNLAAAYKGADDKAANLADQNKSLTAQVDAQQKKVDALNAAMKTAADRYGAGSAEAQKYREQVAKAEGELGKMKTALDKSTKAMEDQSSASGGLLDGLKGLADQFGVSTKAMEDQSGASGGLLDGLKGLADQFGVQLPGSMDKLLEGFGSLAGPAGAAGLLAALGQVAEKLKEVGDAAASQASEMVDLSDETGATTTELQALLYVCRTMEVDNDTLIKGLANLNKKMFEAKEAGDEARLMFEEERTVFDELGISVRDSEGNMRSYTDVLKDLEPVLYEANVKGGTAAQSFKNVGVELKNANGVVRSAEDVLTELYKKLWDAVDGGSAASKMFREMGIDIVDSEGNMRSSVDVLLDVVDALKEYEQGAERSGAANIILGESSRGLVSLLNTDAKSIEIAMNNAMRNIGLMSESMVKELDKDQKAIAKTDAAFQNFLTAVGASGRLTSTYDPSVKIESGANARKALGNWLSQLWSQITHQYARGTSYHPGGLALVGERGTEIVDLPRGSAVYPTGTAPAGTTNNYYDVKIDASRIRELNDIVRIAENERVSRRMGVAK